MNEKSPDFQALPFKESVYYKKGATLSQRFDELLEDNFTGWEFKSITGSPRELNTNPTLRYAAFDDHRKSTAKPLSQQNSQTRLLDLIVPTPMTVFAAYELWCRQAMAPRAVPLLTHPLGRPLEKGNSCEKKSS
uniref:Uncharacterized protein n=1 Tax=Timema bartmani TaxID=61472 RepID=A0A7R9I6Z6_9NEOP|nr:unnamed protein product [Timema bartmani]